MERDFNSKSKVKTKKIVITGMLSAISIFLGVTGLGFIPIPPVKATIMHIPVIIGGILEGPIVGALVGLCFGLFSMYQNFTAPTPTSFIFLNPIIALVPRILIGVSSYYIYKVMTKGVKKNLNITGISVSLIVSILVFSTFNTFFGKLPSIILSLMLFFILSIVSIKFKHKNKEQALSIGTSAILASLVNTAGVLGLIYLLYLENYSKILGIPIELTGKAILGIGITNGIPEAIISALITIPVVIAIKNMRK